MVLPDQDRLDPGRSQFNAKSGLSLPDLPLDIISINFHCNLLSLPLSYGSYAYR
jgi:hypothetical protein